MKLKIYILFILGTLIIYSCDELWLDNGKIITKELHLEDFAEISINDMYDIELIQDTINKIKITGGSKIIAKLDINIKNSILEINTSSHSDWAHDYDRIKLTIYFTELEKITLNEPCSLYSNDTIRIEKLTLHALAEYADINLLVNIKDLHFANSESSAGVYIINGYSDNFTCWVRGSGILKALNLDAQNAFLRSQSICDCYIHVKKNLKVLFENKGKIYYIGNPTIVNETPNYASQLIQLKND